MKPRLQRHRVWPYRRWFSLRRGTRILYGAVGTAVLTTFDSQLEAPTSDVGYFAAALQRVVASGRALGFVAVVFFGLVLSGCPLTFSVGDGGPDEPGDAGLDGGAPRDAGPRLDAGADAGEDGGGDAGIDAGLDAGLDAGFDAGLDAGLDAGVDAGFDAGPCPAQTFGVSCQPCAACVNGACDDGRLGTGVCICGPGNIGPACDEVATDCSALQTAAPRTPSGTYYIDPDGSESVLAPFLATCDMETEGGGWTLVLNYLHARDTNPDLSLHTSTLPLEGSSTLGDAEDQSPQNWGHANQALLQQLGFEEVRFFGATSNHNRLIHFSTTNPDCLGYLSTDSDSCLDVANDFRPLAGHSADLPASTNAAYTNQDDFSMTQYPFYRPGGGHWSAKGGGNRWEVDDFEFSDHDTLHRAWTRRVCPDGTYGAGCALSCACSFGTCETGRSGGCQCVLGASGANCDTIATSCLNASDVIDGTAEDGIYLIDVDGTDGEPPFEVYCDMTFDGGGWTLLAAFDDGQDITSGGVVPGGDDLFMPEERMLPLANASTQVHVRSAGLVSQSITSVPSTLAIENLRELYPLNANSPLRNSSPSAAALWTGPYAQASRLWHECGIPPFTADYPRYPALYWACNNANGLHILSTYSGWRADTPEDMEVYVR